MLFGITVRLAAAQAEHPVDVAPDFGLIVATGSSATVLSTPPYRP